MHRNDLPIPKPCSADWDAMAPRDKGRFCSECAIEVVDVSAYREADAESIRERVRTSNTRLCVSYVVRTDGTVRFTDSPDVPVRKLQRRSAAMAAAASFALAACGGSHAGMRTAGSPVPMPTTDTNQVLGQVASCDLDHASTLPAGTVDPSPDHATEDDDEAPEVRLAGEPIALPPPNTRPEDPSTTPQVPPHQNSHK